MRTTQTAREHEPPAHVARRAFKDSHRKLQDNNPVFYLAFCGGMIERGGISNCPANTLSRVLGGGSGSEMRASQTLQLPLTRPTHNSVIFAQDMLRRRLDDFHLRQSIFFSSEAIVSPYCFCPACMCVWHITIIH